jgi:hypothetical protein
MRPTRWNPAEFAYGYLRADPAKGRLIWDGLKPEERKLFIELETFRRFARSAGIEYESESELTLDPNSASPPPPDIVCNTKKGLVYFELGEVIEEGLAAKAARAAKRKEDYGGAIDLWRPLLRIYSKKRHKQYNANAAPLSLLLHYGVGRQASFFPFLAPHLPCALIQERVERGLFQAVWLYDAQADAVLARFAKGEPPFVKQDG